MGLDLRIMDVLGKRSGKDEEKGDRRIPANDDLFRRLLISSVAF